MKMKVYKDDKVVLKKEMKESLKVSKYLKKILSQNIISFYSIHNLNGNKALIEFAFDNVKHDLIYGEES